jgi:hypothetical protein
MSERCGGFEQYSSRGNNVVPAGVAAMEQATAKRDAALARAQAVLEQQGDRLLASYPNAPVPFLPADLAPAAQFTVASADSTLPPNLLSQGAGLLCQATDPVTPRETRLKANLLLHHAYLRVLRRFGGKPPKHWEGVWAPLAVELADLIERHIDTTWERAQYRLAVEAVEGFRSGLRFLITTAQQQGRWPEAGDHLRTLTLRGRPLTEGSLRHHLNALSGRFRRALRK